MSAQHDWTPAELLAQLHIARAELKVVRNQRELLRNALVGVQSLALVESTHGSLAWRRAVAEIERALAQTGD